MTFLSPRQLCGAVPRDEVVIGGSRAIEDQHPRRIPALIMTIRRVALIGQAVVPAAAKECL